MQPKVTIIMPCYNAGKYLAEAIQSILIQSYENIELLLMDDGSTDNSIEIMQQFSESDRRISIIKNENNIGLIRTLNKGLEIASGEYIARMDSDDISEKHRIQILVDALETMPELSLVSTSNYYINSNGKLTHFYHAKGIHTQTLKFISFFSTPVVHSCILARKSVLKESLYDIDYIHSEDYELFSRLLFQGHKFMNIDEPLYFIRLHLESVSRVYEDVQINTHIKISKRNIENYFKIIPDETSHKIIVNRFNFSPTANEISKAFKLIDKMKVEFLHREKCSSQDLLEIERFIQEQKIDVIIQSFKYKKYNLGVLFYGLKNLKLFLNKAGRKYLMIKLRSKYNK